MMSDASAPLKNAGARGYFMFRRFTANNFLAWIAGAISAALATSGGLYFAQRRQVDIFVYLNGASHLFNNHLYQIRLSHGPHLPFTYPPFAALVFEPLTFIPITLVRVLWTVANITAMYAIIYLSIRAVFSTAPTRMLALLSLISMTPVFLLDPVRQTFSFGQINLVIAALVLLDVSGQVKIGKESLPRGVLIGVASAIKLTPLIFILYLLATRRVRAAWVALATFALSSVIAAVLSPRTSWFYWTRYVTDATRIGKAYYISNQSVRAVADRVDHEVVAPTLVTLISAVVLISGILIAAWAFRASSDLLGILLCATTGLLVSPVTWDHHLVWVVPVVIWLACSPDRPPFGRVWAIVTAMLFWLAPIWVVPNGNGVELGENYVQLLAGNAFFIAMGFFVVGATAMLVLRRQRSRQDECMQVVEIPTPPSSPAPSQAG